MDAFGLALVAAALFGAMPVAVRFAFRRPLPVAVGTLVMQIVAAAVLVVAAAIQGGLTTSGIWPLALAGVVAPGLSQLFVTAGIREAGSSRASVAFGTAPLVAVLLAVSVFGERPEEGVLVGGLLIVAGGLTLALERDRPAHLRAVGIVYALIGACLFALRDNLVRHLSLDTDVPSMTAGAVTMLAAIAVTGLVAVVRRNRFPTDVPTFVSWLPPGLLVGLAYVALFEAFYRGQVSVVAPVVGIEALFGVAFSALLLGRSERVGWRLVLGAVLVVAGGALIAAFV